MVQRFSHIFEVGNCQNLGEEVLHSLLFNLPNFLASRILRSPTIVKRDLGYVGHTGFIILETAHIAIHSFNSSKEITIEVYSYNHFDENYLKQEIAKILNLPSNYVKVKTGNNNINSNVEEINECEEPNCVRKSTTSWGGRKICQDHYEQYEEKHNNRIYSMNDY